MHMFVDGYTQNVVDRFKEKSQTYQFFTLQIHNNHRSDGVTGAAASNDSTNDFTCLYHFGIHGNALGVDKSKHAPSTTDAQPLPGSK